MHQNIFFLCQKHTFLTTLIFDVKDRAVSRNTTGLRLSQLQDIDVWLLKLYLKLNSSLRGILIINSFREVSFIDTNILCSYALCQYICTENFRVLSPHFSFLYSFLWFAYLIHRFFWQVVPSCTWLSFIALPSFLKLNMSTSLLRFPLEDAASLPIHLNSLPTS